MTLIKVSFIFLLKGQKLYFGALEIKHQPNSDSFMKNAIVCELHLEPSFNRRTPGSKRKRLLADALLKFSQLE